MTGSGMTGSGAIEEVLLTISIDTECDHDPQWARSKPLAFDSIVRGLPERLQPAFTDVGAVPTYLLTVEVMEDNGSVAALRDLAGNYEYGTHLHAAFIEPEKKFQDYAGVDSPDFQCACPPDIEFRKLQNLTNLFVEKFNYQPTSFRAGRYGAGANTIESLEKLGYKVDTSVTPFMRWSEPNATVDFRTAPDQPYWPAAGTIIESGAVRPGGLLEVPVSVKKKWIRRTPAWFRPWFSSVDQMKSIFRHHIRQHQDQRVLSLNMMFHSMEVIEKASPYPQSRVEVDRFIGDMHEVLAWCMKEGVTFCGLSDCYDKFLPES